MHKQTILLMAADNRGYEARMIHIELQRSGFRDAFEFETRWAAQPLDLLHELCALKPTIVHFCGQGGYDGVYFQTAGRGSQLVAPQAISETIAAAGSTVRVAVLSSCYSDNSAEVLLEQVDAVVGIDGSIDEEVRRAFATGFYGALGEQESVASAYRHGCAAIQLEGLSMAERPQLRVRPGQDATQLFLATALEAA